MVAPIAQRAVAANRLAANLFFGLGLIIAGVGVFFGIFAWMNDGAAAALQTVLVTAGFGLASVAIGFSFRAIARAHSARSSWRWWFQVLLPLLAAWIGFGLAAEFSGVVDDFVR